MNELTLIASFMPHGMCYLWKPWLMGLHLVSNGLIALAYFSIPITLIYILRKRKDVPFNTIFWLFAAFILFCGAGHSFDIWTLWHPNYWISVWIRLLTALVSLATAIALIIKIPEILTLPSPTQMKEVNQQLQEKITKLEQKEAIIREQEKFLRSIYDNVQEAIFVVDIESEGVFRYRGFNPAAKKLTGVEDVEKKTPAQILPPQVAVAVANRYQECIESKTSITYEEYLPFHNKEAWWLTTLNPIQDDTGKVYRLVGTSLNINDRKQAETELDKEKNFLQALLDNLSDGIVACDSNGVLTLFNKATKEFHGLPQKAIPAGEWAEYYDLYLPDGKTIIPQEDIPLFRALQGESVRDVEMMIIPKQGTPRIIIANGDPIIDSQGNKIGAIAAMRDVTERKQAEQALWESRTRFLQTFVNAAVGMAIVSLDGSWLEVNPALCEMLGYSEQELQATNFQAITHAEDLDSDLAQLERLLSGKIPSYQMEKRYIRKQGDRIWINLSVSLVRDKNEQPLYLIALIENINQRKQAEQALAQLNYELGQLNNQLEEKVKQRTNQLEQLNAALLVTTATLEQRNQELEQFAYVTSHDLKAPLRAIANLSEWIEEDLADKLDEDTRHNMNLLRGRVHRLENMINGLLAYSRVGRLKSEPQEVDVKGMLTDIIDLLDVPEQLQVEIKGEMPTFITELVPLQQVFTNLISNAIKHSDCDSGKITISVTEKDNYFEFSIADNGKGIDPQYHDRIFNIFQTLEARDNKESTGIGLAIVKKAVENQGDKIEVESQLGEGATFRFTWQKND
ncbi:MAG: PAS domain S-box protein [Xenococcaceae cyanobacterium MO_188.B29]|nr:PAS domain S-box protein [Xenococcaceae cyanobacterium MO_188.B29]